MLQDRSPKALDMAGAAASFRWDEVLGLAPTAEPTSSGVSWRTWRIAPTRTQVANSSTWRASMLPTGRRVTHYQCGSLDHVEITTDKLKRGREVDSGSSRTVG
jgi:hypothetical protein